eukprot:TRINITY_DN6404_c0_g2_i4.p1 TRINITY_DN6404_c0_g2~~TRINITY_DN6404_c0_g2_i4.p1  ORF type:complete len:716 (+),score=245.38 TRINITY_DN6404_c0_g2_i4:198-2150(+)
MAKKLDEEQEGDQKLFDKMTCWCKTNKEEKAKSIEDAKSAISTLGSTIEEKQGAISRLEPELRQHSKELNQNKATLEQARTIRGSQVKSFKEDEARLLDSIAGVKEAVQVLQKPSLLQTPGQGSSAARALKKVLEVQRERITISRADRMLIDDFIKDPVAFTSRPGAGFLQSDAHAGDPSDGILGTLKAMADDFAADLQKELDEEKTNKQSYEDLNKAKRIEIDTTEASIRSKKDQLAESEVVLANSKRDLAATKKTLAADQEFLSAVNDKCAAADKEFDARQATRMEESTAVAKAIEVLDEDSSRDLASKTFSFLQESSEDKRDRSAVVGMLKAAGKQLGQEALVTLALTAQIKPFDKVYKAMDDMVTDLQKQQSDEVKERDLCTADINDNALDIEEKERAEGTLSSKIAESKQIIGEADSEAKALQSDIAELSKQLALAGENRQKENVEFKAVVQEQIETQAVLKKALAVLKKVYGGVSLVQVKNHKQTIKDPMADYALAQEDQPALGAPEGFKDYKQNSGGSGVLSLIEQIASDAAQLAAESKQAEQTAQETYEAFAASTTESSTAKEKELADKNSEKAVAEEDLVQAKQSLDENRGEQVQLKKTKVQLDQDCSFVLKNFETRQTARAEEMDAIKKAKAMLGGAKFS